jgi:hypothetical protein
MNIIFFPAAIALIKHLQDRQSKYAQDEYQNPPLHPPIRDRIISEYPLRFVVINNSLGGFAVGVKKVFPKCVFTGYKNIDNEKFSALINKEMMFRFPNVKPIDNVYSGVFQFTDIVFYKLRMFNKKIFYQNRESNWEDRKSTIAFENIITNAKSPNFIIEVDFSKKEMNYKDVLKILKERVPVLNKIKIYTKMINACPFSGQTDIKLFITTFPMYNEILKKRIKSFVVNLDPISEVEDLILPQKQIDKVMLNKNRSDVKSHTGNHSATGKFDKSNNHEIPCAKRMHPNPLARPYLLEDWRANTDFPILRYFSLDELERLAGIPTGWIHNRSHTQTGTALRNATNAFIAQYLMECFALSSIRKFNVGVYHA